MTPQTYAIASPDNAIKVLMFGKGPQLGSERARRLSIATGGRLFGRLAEGPLTLRIDS